jgi:hypothetical protein
MFCYTCHDRKAYVTYLKHTNCCKYAVKFLTENKWNIYSKKLSGDAFYEVFIHSSCTEVN